MADVQQLRAVMDHIEAHPEQHDQFAWYCGTKRCFGGWACTLNGYEFVIDPIDIENTHQVRHPKTGEREEIEDAAQRLLGLTDGEAHELFYIRDTLTDVREYVAALIERCEP